MLRQIFLNFHGNLGVMMELVDWYCTGAELDAVLVAVDQDQKVLKKILDDLPGTKGNLIPGH